jgi:hypothetical protein
MAIITPGAGSTGIAVPALFLLESMPDFTFTSTGPTLATQVFPTGYILEVQGTGLTFTAGKIAGGTVTALKLSGPPGPTYDATGLNIPVADILAGEATPLAGNDTIRLFLSGSEDIVRAGAGEDTVILSALRASQEISVGDDGPVIESRISSDVKYLESVESVHFLDGIEVFGTGTTVAQVERLYLAGLDRAGDPIGLGGWVGAIKDGTQSLEMVAAAVVASAEFAATYGTLDNAEFVTLLYQNVLGRDPGSQELAAWTDQLAQGTSRAQLLIGFSESPEFIDLTSAHVQQGIWAADPDAVNALRLYVTVLDRAPDADGLAGWTALLKSGIMVDQMIAGFTNSTEFLAEYGGLDNRDFVELLYQNALNRDGEAAGVNGWVAQMDGGMTREQVVQGFAFSHEMSAMLNPMAVDGIVFA